MFIAVFTMSNTFSFSVSTATQNAIQTQYNRISSAKRINSAADDAAGSAIASRFTSQINGFNTAIRNAGDGISLGQVADGALSSITENLQRIRELSVQSANGIYNDDDRLNIQKEVDALRSEVDRTLEESAFNGRKLFDGSFEATFQIGPNAGNTVELTIDRLSSDNIGEKTLSENPGDTSGVLLKDLQVTSAQSSQVAIQSIDNVLDSISSLRAEVGAAQNQFESTVSNLRTSEINFSESRSRIEDTDFAKSLSELTANEIREKFQLAMQAKANSNQKQVLDLLNF